MKKVKAFIERGNDGTYGVYIDLLDKTLNYGIHGDGKTAKKLWTILKRLISR